MRSRKGALAAFVLGLAALGLVTSAAEAAPTKFNVLFVAVDDLRPELGCYGKKYIHSPNIDRIAKAGLLFRRAYCQQAVCSPSRSSLLTGARPDTTQVWDLRTHFRKALPDVVTLPEHFKNHGYFVQGMGKIYHLGYDDPRSWSVPWTNPEKAMFALREHQTVFVRKRAAAQQSPARASAIRIAPFEAADVEDNMYHDGALADDAVRALRDIQRKQSKPFFLAVGFIRPHLPFVAPKRYYDLYDPARIELARNPFFPKGAPAFAMVGAGELMAYDGIRSGHQPDELARQLKHGYFAAVSYMDAQVGRLLDELESLKLADSTIVVLWGDHGWKLGEHDSWCKHTNTENDANAPLLISVPGMQNPGSETDALVEFVDIYPSLAALAGLPLPAHLEGCSFVPLLEDPGRIWKPAAFSQYPREVGGQQLMGYSMRTDRYRFTRWVERKNHNRVRALELYDHQTDPEENMNVADDADRQKLIEQLTKQLLEGWQGAKPPAK